MARRAKATLPARPSASVQAEIDRYMKMPYAKELVPDEDGAYFARIVELPGCMTQGDDLPDALRMLDEAMSLWLWGAIEDHIPIPEPVDREFSGRFVVRVPATLHRDLVRRAEHEGVSLNMLAVAALARAVGQER